MKRWIFVSCVGLILTLLGSSAYPMTECVRKAQPPITPMGAPGLSDPSAPFVICSEGDTTWLQVHSSASYCPGDPYLGHGGEATGGPSALETWCFEGGPGDSCGTNPPWDTNCFKHVDVRALPSQTGVNFWHVDTYRANQRAYCGSYALWCGSSALWQGEPVECGTWINPPGYGNQWNSHVQLSLDADFDVAGGCTVYFDPRYDLECKYDYFYVDYLSKGPAPTYLETWKTLATFNGTSNTSSTTCGDAKPNPDYFGNGDQRGVGGANCNWEERGDPSWPAFKGIITVANLGTLTDAPKFRWRMTSDGAWSDADGSGNTDGAAYLDNVMVYGDNPAGPGNASVYTQDFETGTLDPTYWGLPNPRGVTDQWHIVRDPDPPYEGGDGGSRYTCVVDSSFVYRARPEKGYPTGASWRNGWYYRLMTPRVPIQNSGCILQYDNMPCVMDYTCDYSASRVRFYDSDHQQWCPWEGYTGWICNSGCYFMYTDDWEDVTAFYGASAESMQFAWDIMDVGLPGEACYGKHTGTDYVVDNVSIGFFDENATWFSARGIDLLHDSFLEEVAQGYNSFFDTYDPDTIARYSGATPAPLPKQKQLYLDCYDPDGLVSVKLVGSTNGGATWVEKSMTLKVPYDPYSPELGGEYYGTLTAWDFVPGATAWVVGTNVWYYLMATDELSNVVYFPARANPAHPAHDGTADDYLSFSIMPTLPPGQTEPKILLVDGHGRRVYDYAPCVSAVDQYVMLESLYEQTLTDAGYTCDRFDISGAGSNRHIHPVEYSDYDAVVWFTGPYFSNYLFDKEAQTAIRDYLADGGKVVLCGDRIAYNMEVVGEDSLGGEFLGGVMGATYVDEMPSAFTYPYVYAATGGSANVFGTPVAIDLEPIAIYRECPYLKDFSYVLTNASPPAGYTAQQLMYIANPTIAAADEVIYTEYQGTGQAVFVNFDLCATVNHSRGYCDGDAATPAPDFAAGTYDGRVELLHVILEDIFGLPSSGGTAGVPGVPSPGFGEEHAWSLGQNSPNPCGSATEISYMVGRAGGVRIKVYDTAGRLVRALIDRRLDPGRYVATWDGCNSAGQRVSSGVYFYTLEGLSFKATKKMLVVQ